MNFLTFLQIISSLILIVLVLLQERGSGLSGILGGGEASTPYHTRRGLEKVIYWGTIVTAIIFGVTAILNLVVLS